MTAPMMNPLLHLRTMHETDDQTSSTCFDVPNDADQTIAFDSEIQSNQQQLRLGPCCAQRQNNHKHYCIDDEEVL